MRPWRPRPRVVWYGSAVHRHGTRNTPVRCTRYVPGRRGAPVVCAMRGWASAVPLVDTYVGFQEEPICRQTLQAYSPRYVRISTYSAILLPKYKHVAQQQNPRLHALAVPRAVFYVRSIPSHTILHKHVRAQTTHSAALYPARIGYAEQTCPPQGQTAASGPLHTDSSSNGGSN